MASTNPRDIRSHITGKPLCEECIKKNEEIRKFKQFIPILYRHNSTRVIGKFENGIITISEGFYLTRDMIFEIFGNCGFQILESEQGDKPETLLISKFKILEWSI